MDNSNDNRDNTPAKPPKKEKQKITGAEKRQKRLIKKTRGGQVLSEDEVKKIVAGRKKLRRDMRKMGIKSRKEFELTASGLGLYFDKNRVWPLFLMFFRGKLLWLLLAAALALLLALGALSVITELRGHFTINLTDDLFKEGFELSITPGFENPTSTLYSEPAENAPCISIVDIPKDVDFVDGPHNGSDHFAYTYYVRFEGDRQAAYNYRVILNSEGKSLSQASWVMLFEDGKMSFFAKKNDKGGPEMIPSVFDNKRGYIEPPFMDVAKFPSQFQKMAVKNEVTFYRLIPCPFITDAIVTEGYCEVMPGDVHKYTVVIWLEGDDPDCNNSLIGGHVGLEMDFKLIEENDYS